MDMKKYRNEEWMKYNKTILLQKSRGNKDWKTTLLLLPDLIFATEVE